MGHSDELALFVGEKVSMALHGIEQFRFDFISVFRLLDQLVKALEIFQYLLALRPSIEIHCLGTLKHVLDIECS